MSDDCKRMESHACPMSTCAAWRPELEAVVKLAGEVRSSGVAVTLAERVPVSFDFSHRWREPWARPLVPHLFLAEATARTPVTAPVLDIGGKVLDPGVTFTVEGHVEAGPPKGRGKNRRAEISYGA
ncbi:hypothetical protein ABZ917_36405 [Nonomuraea wenchangensis]